MASRAITEPLSDADYSLLLEALSSSGKGRLFLEEYRRRNRPTESSTLLDSLQRIEAIVATVHEQLLPEQLAEELRRIAMTIEIALDGVDADPKGGDAARRFVLIAQAHKEMASLAASFAGRLAAGPAHAAGPGGPEPIELTSDHVAFLDELGLADYEASAER
jgi:hypothetical protein